MAQASVRIEGGRALSFYLGGLSKKLRNKVMPELVKKSAFVIERDIKKKKLSGDVLTARSGHLRRSIASVFHGSKQNFGGTVGSNVVYLPIHEFGGVIKPRKKKALKFSIPGVGFVTVKSVRIPKRSPMQKGFLDSLSPIDRVIDRVISRAIA